MDEVSMTIQRSRRLKLVDNVCARVGQRWIDCIDVLAENTDLRRSDVLRSAMWLGLQSLLEHYNLEVKDGE